MKTAPAQTSHDTEQDIKVFDRSRIRHNRQRAAANFSQHSFMFDWADKQLNERLADIKREFPLALQIGTRGPAPQSSKINHLISMDICNASIIADEEFLPFAGESLDLVLSTLNLHSTNDLPGALLQIRKALKPDGLFIASMLGGETLHELRQVLTQAEINIKGGASPRVSPFADKQQMGALLQRAGFNLPVIDSDIVTVTYDNIFKLFHDLRGMGEGNAIFARNKTPPGKALFLEAARLYQEQFAEKDGRIVASFEVIFLLGWAPHESQQKPLRPGSAEHSLAEALDTNELKTGDIAGS
ncbi:MAG: methyltransferase [Micavibrio sp.]|nr:MAG: methyltransferase [Micavibrio sp.]